MAGGVVRGVVLCFTSILPEQRSELVEIASQMGATHKFDLTSDVTHLLVGETNTEKYKYVARERTDVTVLLPQWIEAVRQSWMQGGDTDLKALEEQYKLPTFYGLSICITGFEDMAFRKYLQETAIANGAEFNKDLTRNVTHLIAREPKGQKYKFATQWKIKIVSLKWFEDSLERGMILDESLYDPLLPPEQQGVGAWNRSAPSVSAKREQPENASNPRARKLRRVASSKLGDRNEGIWGDIVGGGFEVAENGNSDTTHPRTGNPPSGRARPVIQVVKSFASETTVSDQRDRGPSVPEEKPLDQPQGFLQNCYFFIHGFTPKQVDVLRHHLTFNGAHIVESLSEFASPDIPKTGHGLYIIVPYKLPRSEIPSTDDMAFECEVVTDMWLERCLDSKTLVPPESHVTSTPFPRFPIPGPEFGGMKICSTGFARIDLLHLSKLVNIMGATYEEYLTPSASVLICNDPQTANPEKLRHTLEWGVPTVSADWLWISVQTGQRKPFDPYLIQKPSSQSSKAEQKSSNRSDSRSKQPVESRSKEESRKAPKQGAVSKPESASSSTKSDVSNPPPVNGHNDAPKDKSTNASVGGLDASKSRSPSKGLDSEKVTTEPARREETGQAASSRNTTKALENAVNGLLQQVRAFSRASSNSGGEGGEQQPVRRRRPVLGRTNSLSSTRTGPTKGISRASSVDTLNEDGYGSAVSADTDTNNQNSSKNLTNMRGQSFNSVLSGGKVNVYVDSPLYEDEEQEGDGTPAMTQLNYEDPDAVAMREEFMKRGGKSDNSDSNNNDNNKDPAKQDTAGDEVRELEDIEGGWGSAKRTRRAGKPKEPDNNIF
ncbi:BRCT domain protein [Rasamsonia emersonii CBS 393.64]|uniref:BRCT domain protein n=1 Tax=Rasamsonia emersonii (strain ATCC 16479 / CBS 393.64 / IMI 116815) TaxID=1408163 RepID=A0A0F4YQ03_RASE3|nr:BRCT domain protein [Rasamsonia emersonii CBS 393.64]KKA19931.1 BRCT domain protein [Rasamsonia emersonii CBS 393.64]